MYTQTTQRIKITVQPTYLDHQSSPENGHFVWAYTIGIENLSEQVVQLISRYWHITDGMGRVQEVNGPGVVGKQPVLKPGEAFKYTSGTSLSTSSGMMSGRYHMRGADGKMFDIIIPAFSLDSPEQVKRPN